MSFPKVRQRVQSYQPFTYTNTATMPTGIQAGDLLFAAVAIFGDPDVAVAVGWIPMNFSTNPDSNAVSAAMFIRVATGTADDNFVCSYDTQVWSSNTIYQISGAKVSGPVPLFFCSAKSTNGDPPNLVTDQKRDYLWLATAFEYNRSYDPGPNNGPSNYTNFNANNLEPVANTALYISERELNAKTEDPGAYVGVTVGLSYTVAIPGSANNGFFF